MDNLGPTFLTDSQIEYMSAPLYEHSIRIRRSKKRSTGNQPLVMDKKNSVEETTSRLLWRYDIQSSQFR